MANNPLRGSGLSISNRAPEVLPRHGKTLASVSEKLRLKRLNRTSDPWATSRLGGEKRGSPGFSWTQNVDMTLFLVVVGWSHTPAPGPVVEAVRSLALKVDSVCRIIRSKLSNNIRTVCAIQMVDFRTDGLILKKDCSATSVSNVRFLKFQN